MNGQVLRNRFLPVLLVLVFICLVFFACAEKKLEFHNEAKLFYNWIVSESHPDTALPTSHIGDPNLKDWCHTYDAAVCVIAFLAMEDLDRARKMIDFYVGKKSIRRLGGVIEAVKNSSSDGQGVEWQVRTGSNAWLGLAAFHLYFATKNQDYLNFAKQQADFLLSLQDANPQSITYGGIPLGPKGVPNNPKDQHIMWDENNPEFVEIYSTEGNVDAWALFNMIASVTEDKKYELARERVLEWLKEVGYNATEKRLNRGYYRAPDTFFSPDTHFWAISALGPSTLDRWEPELAHQLMEYAKNHSEVNVSYQKANGEKVHVTGYDFVSKESPVVKERGLVVSPEWTFQAVLAYSLLSQQSKSSGTRDTYETKRISLLKSILSMADRDENKASYPYATKGNVSIGHEYKTPAEGSRSVIGAAWAILALKDYDPLNLDKLKNHTSKN